MPSQFGSTHIISLFRHALAKEVNALVREQVAPLTVLKPMLKESLGIDLELIREHLVDEWRSVHPGVITEVTNAEVALSYYNASPKKFEYTVDLDNLILGCGAGLEIELNDKACKVSQPQSLGIDNIYNKYHYDFSVSSGKKYATLVAPACTTKEFSSTLDIAYSQRNNLNIKLKSNIEPFSLSYIGIDVTCSDFDKKVITLVRIPGVDPDALATAVMAFASKGFSVHVINDTAGLVGYRIFAILTNTAASLLQQAFCTSISEINVLATTAIGIEHPIICDTVGDLAFQSCYMTVLANVTNNPAFAPVPWITRQHMLANIAWDKEFAQRKRLNAEN